MLWLTSYTVCVSIVAFYVHEKGHFHVMNSLLPALKIGSLGVKASNQKTFVSLYLGSKLLACKQPYHIWVPQVQQLNP